MAALTDLLQRRRFDFEVLRDMACDTFRAQAYASTDDLNSRRGEITSVDQADRAGTYRFVFHIPTLVGPGRFTTETEIGIQTEVTDYPRNEPTTWIVSAQAPWSPHFRQNAPVCLGDEFWKPAGGHITLGHLAIHIARMLNWDEKGRGAGYVGWNGPAIEYHRKHYGDRPLNPDIVYPNLPFWLNPAPQPPSTGFEILGRSAPRAHVEFKWS